MTLTMENHRFKVEVEMAGAEIGSIWDKEHKREYLWQGDPAIWPHRSPVLFPLCGPLEGDRFEEGGQDYTMGREGLAMGLRHKLVCHDKGLICLRLESTPQSMESYPYRFAVKTTYSLKANHVSSRMKVLNYGKETMYFRCGFLTALAIPFVPGTAPGDYALRMEQPEALTLLERNEAGLLTRGTHMWEPEGGLIPIAGGALDSGVILKEPNSQYLQLECKNGANLRFYLRGAPYTFLRTTPAGGAPRLLSIGDWHGAPDFVGAPAAWDKKENVIALGAMEEYYVHQTIVIGDK